jgi:hypothetical protein
MSARSGFAFACQHFGLLFVLEAESAVAEGGYLWIRSWRSRWPAGATFLLIVNTFGLWR